MPDAVVKPTRVSLRTDDGAALHGRLYEPPGPAAGGVVIAGGTGLTQRLYRHLAAYLAGRGLETLTFDYRGMGENKPPSLRGYAATKSQWGRVDFAAARAFVRDRDPARPLFVVGHSFGGQALGFCADAERIDAAVLIAAQSGWIGHWRGADFRRLWWAWHVTVPWATAMRGYLPGRHGTGEDLPAGVAREWGRWCRTRGFFTALHPDTLVNFAALRCPVLSLAFADDGFFAPPPAVDELLSWLPNAGLTDRRIAPADLEQDQIGHFGAFGRAAGERLWPEIAAFLGA